MRSGPARTAPPETAAGYILSCFPDEASSTISRRVDAARDEAPSAVPAADDPVMSVGAASDGVLTPTVTTPCQARTETMADPAGTPVRTCVQREEPLITS